MGDTIKILRDIIIIIIIDIGIIVEIEELIRGRIEIIKAEMVKITVREGDIVGAHQVVQVLHNHQEGEEEGDHLALQGDHRLLRPVLHHQPHLTQTHQVVDIVNILPKDDNDIVIINSKISTKIGYKANYNRRYRYRDTII